MKKEIHPKYDKVMVRCGCGAGLWFDSSESFGLLTMLRASVFVMQ